LVERALQRDDHAAAGRSQSAELPPLRAHEREGWVDALRVVEPMQRELVASPHER
ncbi:MAG: hypothetical protein GIX03_10060, partial [Candidatus Eremiobacteraeota bacterium]|nr:hypothetical protein [Candidatus Eremiobacteraeota bacterium]